MSFKPIKFSPIATMVDTQPCHHVYLVDVSGSMYSVLPDIREHLKNVTSLVIKPEDTMSLMFFSGKNEYGVIFSNMSFADAMALDSSHKAIDKYLHPIGLTGFADPLKMAITLKREGHRNNLIMMTDGYDNVSRRDDILTVIKQAGEVFDNCAFIEYGYYADRELLANMAMLTGGYHVFTGGFDSYTKELEAQFTRDVESTRDVEVSLKTKHIVYVKDDDIRIVEPTENLGMKFVRIPESLEKAYSTTDEDIEIDGLSEDELYLFAYYGLKTNQTNYTWDCLAALGDVLFIDMFTNAFTKQELSSVTEGLRVAAIIDKKQRFIIGKDKKYLPNNDVTTVLDVLSWLEAHGGFLDTQNPLFNYNRTTAGREFNDDEDNQSAGVEVIPKPCSPSKITGLVYNSTRPNISIQVTQQVTLFVPKNEYGIEFVPSTQIKNYTIIRDGIINLPTLPLVVSRSAMDALASLTDEFAVIEGTDDDNIQVIVYLDNLPVISRANVKRCRFSQLAYAYFDGIRRKAELKVMKHLLGKEDRAAMAGLKETYGDEAAAWLDSIGIRDYGYSPVGTKKAPKGDSYSAVELVLKAKGLSSLPSIAAVEKKIAEKKNLNVADQLIANNLVRYKGVKLTKEDIAERQKLVKVNDSIISDYVFTAILGRQGFSDIKADENGLYKTEVDGVQVTGEIRRIDVKI